MAQGAAASVGRSQRRSTSTSPLFVATFSDMHITFDPTKRARTLKERGLDFADAATVFEGRILTFADNRFDYGETRFITIGFLGPRMVMVVWTPRADARHVISMRKTNDRETRRYLDRMG